MIHTVQVVSIQKMQKKPNPYGKMYCRVIGREVNNMKKARKAEPHITEFTEQEVLPMWTPNTIIRHRTTGRALLVIHVYRNCTMVVDLTDQSELVAPLALLEREYHYWARDTDMKNDDPVNFGKDWHYKPTFM